MNTCTHKADHQHGTRMRYVVDFCRCDLCRDANRRETAERRRRDLYGRSPWVAAEPVRQHVRQLMAAGMGWKRIAQVAGVPNSNVCTLLYGKRLDKPGEASHRPPSKRILGTTAAKLLAVELDLADGQLVSAIGTRRRIQALACIGWTMSRQGARIGWAPANFAKLLTDDTVTVRRETAQLVARMYDDLWDRAPGGDRFQRAGITRVKQRAAANGWLPPLAWDDDTIDDPAATPHMPQDAPHKGHALVEDVEFLLKTGETFAVTAQRLGLKPSSLQTALRRAGRPDLIVRHRLEEIA